MKIAATKCSKKLLTVRLCQGGKAEFYFSKTDFILLNFIKVNNSRVIAPGQVCAKPKKKSDRITCICCPSDTVVVLHELCIVFDFFFGYFLLLLNSSLLLTDRQFSWLSNCYQNQTCDMLQLQYKVSK